MPSVTVRVVTISGPLEAAGEIEKVGADPYSVRVMAPKMTMRTVRLEGIDNRAANLVKQEMLSLGGEAAVARPVSSFARGRSDVLVGGTLKQYGLLLKKLARQPFGLSALSEQIAEALSNYDRTSFTVPAGRYRLALGGRPLVMGILNVTPDSFSDGGTFSTVDAAVERAHAMAEAGAAIIDIGGESSRPGARPVGAAEERARVVPVIRRLARRLKIPISVDTYKLEVARAALDEGAVIVNDITALRSGGEAMAAAARKHRAAVVLMHMKGLSPRTMQKNPVYGDVTAEVTRFLRERIAFARANGIGHDRIIADPGIGFGKTAGHNLELLRSLAEFRALGVPLLVGASRKAFIGRILGDVPVDRRVSGSIASAVWSAAQGAHILRVHDVAETAEAVKIIEAIGKGSWNS